VADPHADLLIRIVDNFLAGGPTDTSLRALAADIGTSHRMLLYHFTSFEGLIAEVVDEVEDRQRQALTALPTTGADLPTLAREFWQHNSSPRHAPVVRLFFGLYTRLLDRGATDRAARLVSGWLTPATTLLVAAGVSTEQATILARLGLGVTRGLLLDLLATGDTNAVNAAMDAYIDMAFGARR